MTSKPSADRPPSAVKPGAGDDTGGAEFRRMFEQSDDGIALLNGAITVCCNRKILDILELAEDEVVGKTPWEISPVRPIEGVPDEKNTRQFIREALSGKVVRFDWMHYGKDGSRKTLDVTLKRIDVSGNKNVLVTMRDVSDQRRAEHALQARLKFQDLLESLAGQMISLDESNVDERILGALAEIGVSFDIDRVSMWWLDPVNDTLQRTHQWAQDEMISEVLEIPIAAAPWSCARIAARESIYFSNPAELPAAAERDRDLFERDKVRSYLMAPVIVDDSRVGCISHAMLTRARTWTAAERREIGLVSSLVATAWQRADRLRKIRASEADLVRSQRVARVGTYFETPRPGVSLDDAHGKSTLSAQACEIFGIGPEDASFDDVFELVHPDDKDKYVNSIVDTAPDGTEGAVDYRIIRTGGETLYIEDRWEIERDEAGTAVKVIGTVRDVTERELANAALRDAYDQLKAREAELLRSQRAAGVGSYIETALPGKSLEYDFGLFEASDTAYEIFGAKRPDLSAEMIYESLHPDDRDAYTNSIIDVPADSRFGTLEYRLLRPDKSIVYVEDHWEMERDANGKVVKTYGTVRNVTERVLANKKLREALDAVRLREMELLRSQHAANIGTISETALPGTTLADQFGAYRMSPQACKIFGFEPGTETVEEFLSRVHPDDKHIVDNVIVNSMPGRDAFHNEYRYIRPDGKVIHVEEFLEADRNEKGEVISILGTVQDVTERVEVRQELQKALHETRAREAELLRSQRAAKIGSTLQVARPGTCLTKELGILQLSPQACEILGFEPGSESIEALVSRLHPDDRPKVQHAIQGLRPEDTSVSYQYRVLRPDGSAVHVEEFLDIERDEKGNVVRILGTSQDVTTRVEARLELEKALAEIRVREAELLRSQRAAKIGSTLETARPGSSLADEYGISRLSPQACELFGFEPGSESVEEIIARIHPDDRQRVSDAIENLRPGESEIHHQYRLIRPDGTLIHIEEFLEIDRDEAGNVTKIFGTAQDVTERVKARLELEKALTELRALKDRLQDENVFLRKEFRAAQREKKIVGDNPRFRSALVAAEKVAPTDVTVLILGETGTGKELVAQEIHELSDRHDTPMISVNCAALSTELIESELFGHEAGAFTGAQKGRAGRFELANGGTLFLDEIGDLPSDVQAKILRVLQTGEFERLGSNKTLQVDVRLIAATNRNLRQMIRDGEFRADLFFRINSFPIELPSLRERADDIPMLVNYFVEKHADRLGRNIETIAPDMITRMTLREWPGNVRELEGYVQRAIIASSGPVLDYSEAEGPEALVAEANRSAIVGGARDLDAVQEQHIVDVLNECDWVIGGKSGAAAVLGMPPSTLRSRMKKLGIERPVY